jgi:hypothetical protein
MTQSIKKIGIGSIAFAAFMLLVLPTSFAQATDIFGDDSYSSSYWYPDAAAADDSYSSSYWYPDAVADDSYSSSYWYPDQTSGYGMTGGYGSTGFMTGGFSTGGYSTGGGYMTGGGYRTPSYSTPVVATPSNTTINTDASVCSHSVNSCNHDDHSVVNITNPAPVINNNNVVANYAPTPAPVQQYCAAGYYGTYPNCYRQAPVAQPVVYSSATPYIALSQTPYTGLELGFWGSIAYWGFMVVFALFAAYLIAIKRVQNTVANYLKSVLFGTDDEEVEAPTTDETPEAPAFVAAATKGDEIDSFIMSQINRARHA